MFRGSSSKFKLTCFRVSDRTLLLVYRRRLPAQPPGILYTALILPATLPPVSGGRLSSEILVISLTELLKTKGN